MAKSKKKPEILKLDLGCGETPVSGFKGVDFYAKADFKVNLRKFPWPWKSDSVSEVWCSHFFEHIPGPERIPFMDELYRVLIPGGKATIITPYWTSARAVQDPTHAWPPVAVSSYLYFNKGWREANKLTHYLGKCDFDFSYGYLLTPETASKEKEAQEFFIKHYLDAVSDLQVVLTKREE